MTSLRVVALAVWTFLAGGTAGLARNVIFWDKVRGARAAAWWTSLWGRGATRIIGCRVRVSGTRPAAGSFVAANHTTWADILVFGGESTALFQKESSKRALWQPCGGNQPNSNTTAPEPVCPSLPHRGGTGPCTGDAVRAIAS